MNWVATIFIILGFIGICNKNPAGFLVQGAGCLIYVLLNIDPAVSVTNFVFLIINLVGYFKWTKQDDK